LAQRAAGSRGVSLLRQGERRTSEDLKSDKLSPAPDQDLESIWIFKSASSCCRIEHRVSMKFEGSLMGFLCIKAELFKMIQSV